MLPPLRAAAAAQGCNGSWRCGAGLQRQLCTSSPATGNAIRAAQAMSAAPKPPPGDLTLPFTRHDQASSVATPGACWKPQGCGG